MIENLELSENCLSTVPIKPSINVPEKGKVIPVSGTTPAILNVGDNITSLTNNTVRVKCPISGIPKPKVKWYRNGNEIQTGERYVIDSNETLTVIRLNKEDVGLFTCRVQNRFGKDSRTTSIDVVGE